MGSGHSVQGAKRAAMDEAQGISGSEGVHTSPSYAKHAHSKKRFSPWPACSTWEIKASININKNEKSRKHVKVETRN